MSQSSLDLDDPPPLPPPLENPVGRRRSSSTTLLSPEAITPLSSMPQSSSKESVMSGTGNIECRRGRQKTSTVWRHFLIKPNADGIISLFCQVSKEDGVCTYDCQGTFLLYHEWLHIQGLYMYKQRPTVTEATDDGSKQGIIIVLNKSLYIHTYSNDKYGPLYACR